MYKIEHEADVINLVGYNTPLKFEFLSDGIAEFKTLVANKNKEKPCI